jgi:hypothetical protein
MVQNGLRWPQNWRRPRGDRRREIKLTFPVASTAPPIVTTSFTLRNASGSSAAARAQFVSGPMATMVIVSGSFSRKILSISLWAGWDDALKEKVGSVRSPVSFAASVIIESGGGCSNECFHVSSGERCGCYNITLSGYGRPLYLPNMLTVVWMPPSPSVPSGNKY